MYTNNHHHIEKRKPYNHCNELKLPFYCMSHCSAYLSYLANASIAAFIPPNLPEFKANPVAKPSYEG